MSKAIYHPSRRSIRRICILIVVTVAFFCNNLQAAFYNITDLGTLVGGNSSVGYGINASGQVTGVSNGEFGLHAFLYSDGAMKDLGTLGGIVSYGYSINDSGQVAGYSEIADNHKAHAFRYSGGVMSDLGTLGGAQSRAYGINNSGQVTGESEISVHSRTRAFLSNGTAMTALENGNYSSSTGQSINASGDVAGSISFGYTNAFVANEVGVVNLGTLDTFFGYSNATSMNDKGQVTGNSKNAAGESHAFLYSDGVMIDLGTLGGGASSGHGINVHGQVVGWSSATGNASDHAFVFSDGVIQDLNSLIDPRLGWELKEANAINASGQITGRGEIGGESRAFLLTPVPEPASWLLLGLGAIALAWSALRQRSRDAI